jgi:hypothetical protein
MAGPASDGGAVLPPKSRNTSAVYYTTFEAPKPTGDGTESVHQTSNHQNLALDELIKHYLATSNNIIGDAKSYNWEPLLRALLKRGILIDPPEQRKGKEKAFPQGQCLAVGDTSDIPMKTKNTGSWDFTWYIPSWTHPEYNPNVRAEYSGKRYLRKTPDPFTGGRPALRPEDVLRNPTGFAKRWGIHPNEIGGRSRMSPTVSETRNPLQDYMNQINMLSDSQKQEAIAQSRELAPAPDPNFIDPVVMQKILERDGGVLPTAELREALKVEIYQNKHNLEELINNLGQQSEATMQANSAFIKDALEDQEYQRYMFRGMTTDELFSENIWTLSNAVGCDLQGDIHP